MLRHVAVCMFALVLVATTGCNMLKPLPPSAPSGPTTGSVGVSYSFTTVSQNPIYDSLSYRFDWGDGITSAWGPMLAPGVPVTAQHAWNAAGSFSVRAQARNRVGFGSDWSEPSLISISSQAGYPDTVTALLDGGSGPVGIAIDPLGQYLYVAARGGGELRVYRTSDNVLESRIAVGGGAYCVCILPNGQKAYVPNVADATVSVVRLSDRQVTATLRVGDGSNFCAALPNSQYVYVSNKEAGTISVIRTSDDVVVSTFSVGQAPWNIVPTPDGQYLYISNSAGSTVTKVRVSDNTIVRTIAVNQCPEGMCLLPGGEYLYVACRTYTESYVDVVRTSDDVVVSRIPVPGYVVEVVPLPGGEYVGYTTHESGEIGFISTATKQVVWSTGSYSGCCYAAAMPGGNRMYVCALHEDHIVVVDRR